MYEEPEDDFLAQAQRKAKKAFLVEEIIEQNYSPILFTKFCEKLKGTDVDEYTFEELQGIVRRFKQKYSPGQADEVEDEEPPPQPSVQPSEDTESHIKPSSEPDQDVPVSPAADPITYSEPSPTDPEESKTASDLPPQAESSGSDDEPPGELPPPSSRPDTDIYFTGLNVEPMFSEAYPVNANYLPENELSQELNTKVTILKYSVESGGLLSASHVMYEIQTLPMNWKVMRKESDFIWLKGVMQNVYPGYYVRHT